MKAFELANTQPWAILPDMLHTILRIAARETDPEAVAAQLGRPLENTYSAEMRNGVAVLPVTGPVMRYANLFSRVSGATSIDRLAIDFNQALQNKDVKAIVLDIDSPGGTVAGVNELAEMIYSARGRKPITAYISSMGASAAYWLACACDEIVVDATANIGSIGVVSVQTDDTERKAKEGIKEIQIVSSLSPRKRPDLQTEEGRADVQAVVDAIAQVFVATVARNRDVTESKVLSDFGQGGLLVGANAVKAGMADRVGSLEQIIARLAGQSSQRGVTMSESMKTETQEIMISHTLIAEQYPMIAEAFRQEGAQHERERIKSVEAQLIAGHEALIQRLKYDGKSTGAEAALQILAAEKQTRSTMLTNLKADAPTPLPMPGIAPAQAEKDEIMAANEAQPTDGNYEAQWLKNSKLQAEFLSKEAYAAYMKAYNNGQVSLYSHN